MTNNPGSVPFGIHLARQGRDEGGTLIARRRHFVNQAAARMNRAGREESALKDKHGGASIYKHMLLQHRSSFCCTPFFFSKCDTLIRCRDTAVSFLSALKSCFVSVLSLSVPNIFEEHSFLLNGHLLLQDLLYLLDIRRMICFTNANFKA